MILKIFRYSWVLIFLLAMNINSFSQCAMCRASMENSISENSESFGTSLNTGILYLFAMPYLMVAIIAYLWYRGSRKNEKKIKISIHSGRKVS